MDMSLFVQSLTETEINELSTAIFELRAIRGRLNAQPLDSAEWAAISRNDKMRAIRLYRDRCNVRIVEAKAAVDLAIERSNT